MTKTTIKNRARGSDADATFFAGANTKAGFVSFYPEIIDERRLIRLYLIKGGPGSGKSTLMRRLIAAAKEAGLYTEAYLCGSDPLSLDAALIGSGDGSVAFIDATSPHAYDARYPGAAATLFDPGAFWDVPALRSHRETVVALADAKGEAYRRAYRYLAALGSVQSDLRRLGEEALDRAKMRAACRRFAAALAKKGEVNDVNASGFTPSGRRCAGCISMRGEAVIDAAADCTTVTVTDSANTQAAFFEVMREELSAANIASVRLCDSVEPEVTAGLIVPSRALRIVPSEGKECGERNFNMARFVCREKLRKTKSLRSFSRKCAESLKEGALSALADAGECHFALEDIYVSAMDFASLSAAQDALIAEAVSLAAGK